MILFNDEKIKVEQGHAQNVAMSDEEINNKYREGEIRIVTEQARYPLNTIASLVRDGGYKLNPEYQRRHRWSNKKRSTLIESLIMNVPLPPIFLYEFEYSSYEVMDGLQRLTAIASFYEDGYALEGLEKWPELNGKTYSNLPKLVKQGIDRRYISSIILLHETAKNEDDADLLKQMVFDRINSGGEKLTAQEKRNANYDGKLNRLCLKLSEQHALCNTWGIPAVTHHDSIHSDRSTNKLFKTMQDVELVLRFFAYRQRVSLQKGSLETYLDFYLEKGNYFPSETLERLGLLFKDTINFAYELLGDSAFFLYRESRGKWSWYERPTTVVYDPLMFALSQNLHSRALLLPQKDKISEGLVDLYQEHYESLEGRNTNPSALQKRDEIFLDYIERFL
ncbi:MULTISPECIES: DUF262 domain-containing protein [unclassified Lentimonas]|uniref:DUF262 domain-containing protein n=1 Tax=unclassified Lentimonas TaxID=2630993 RepID=UPI00132BEAB2|nr:MULTISPECIES: DUF262 domain-containing protein [unclassified Lentimonas]CAA6694980.1 conserved hypothetical protein [Lentimonas sp. CC19]CAA6695333.1 conserved hypothetical protein [Lentimonas sp. CC10]CAA7072012.1 conserved hypothetical protein [Lentimonas sp. CC11]